MNAIQNVHFEKSKVYHIIAVARQDAFLKDM